MKRFYFSKLLILVTLLLGYNASIFAQTTTFSYSTSIQTYSVPAGITQVSVDMAGAKAGNNYNGYTTGGPGGRVQATMNVTPGQILGVYVGTSSPSANCCSSNAGGGNGSGVTGGQGYYYGSGGGGCSEVRIAPYTTAVGYRTIVAGGGGGAGMDCSSSDYGGGGGGLTGGNGQMCGSYNSCYNGTGGTQNSGGNYPTCWSSGPSGSFGNGGNSCTCYYYAGGGGAGYYGGGGSYYYGGGGGGSSYTDPTYVTASTHTQGYYNTNGSGYVSITPLYPTVIATPPSITFPLQTVGTTSIPQYTVLTGVRLTGFFPTNLTLTTSSPAFLISLDGITWSTSATISVTSGTLAATNLYVTFNPGFPITYTGNITVTGAGQPTPLVIPINGTGGTACSSLPTPGVAHSSVPSASSTAGITLSLTGATAGSSIGYQWQSSADSITWTDIIGAVTNPYTYTGITAKTYFRCKVTCPASGTTISTGLSVAYVAGGIGSTSCTSPQSSQSPGGLSSNYGFYVGAPSYPFVLVGDGLTKINDNNTPGNYYYDYTASQSVNLSPGGNYTASNGISPWNQLGFQVWIDFNNDGVFSASESVGGVTAATGSLMPPIPIAIPTTAPYGTFRMRVVVDFSSGCGGSTPCYPSIPPCFTTSISYAEARDYTVNIAQPKCSGTPSPGISYFSATNGCGNYNANFYDIGATTGLAGLSYNWQSSPDGSTGWADITGATTSTYTQAVTSTLYYRERVTCSFGSTATTPVTKVNYNIQPASVAGGTTSFCSNIPTQLSDATPGGAWTSSNMGVASVGTTGIVAGLAGGTSIISYTMASGCNATKIVTVYLAPGPITGNSNLCTSLTSSLSDATPGGVWTSGNSTFATINSSTGLANGIAPGSPVITYTIPAGGCYSVFPITVNTLPAPLGGTPVVCVGSTTTLTETKIGGAWSSSNSFQAAVSSTGLVTGLAAGNPTISYTLPGGCSATTSLVVNPLPAAISGSSNTCVTQTTQLSDGTSGGVWTSTSPTIATVNSSGLVTGVASGASNILYTLSSTGCAIALPETINLLPAVFSITGGGGYCSGSSGTHIGLSGSANGVNYTLYNGSASVSTIPGTTSGIDFGLVTATGVYTVQATDATTFCVNNMTGSTNVSINALPAIYNLSASNGGAYCAGSVGSSFSISGSDVGVSYQVMMGPVAVGAPVLGSGLVAPLNLGNFTVPGTYNVVATNITTLCQSNMTGAVTVSVNTPPTIYAISSNGTSYCPGTSGVDIFMLATTSGISYDLMRGSTVANTMTGSGSAVDFGYVTVAGLYTIRGTDLVSGCVTQMSGSIPVSINPLPAAQIVNGGGAYCSGGAGKHIGLNNSAIGVRYVLMNGSTAIDTVAGSNSSLDFGVQPSIGASTTYTVIGINSLGCQAPMTGSVTVSVNSLPNPYALNGGGGYCAGSAGDTVGMSSTDLGVRYQLYKDGTIATPYKTGTGNEFSFGWFTNFGVYTVLATNSITGCSNTMPGSVTVTRNLLPSVYTVRGGGGFCALDAGADVYLSNSDAGVSYILSVGTTQLGSTPGVTGLLDFGAQPIAGTYTVIAKDNATQCTSNMTGSATVAINPLPTNYTITGNSGYCTGDAGVTLGYNLSTHGVDYTLMNSTGPVGTVLGGTGSPLIFGVFPGETYTVQAKNSITGCTNVSSSLVVTMNPLPNNTYTVTGGGNYCAGDPTSHVMLAASDGGVNYQLYDGSAKVGSSFTGGAAIDFGLVTTTGTYTVKGTDAVTKCSDVMTSSAMVNINPAPTVYTVMGGGSRCASDAGITITVGGSDLGTNYTVSNKGVVDGSYWAGTGLPIFVGTHTDSGSYVVVATNPTTGCTSTMADSATITIRPTNVPSVMVGGSDTLCSGSKTTYTAMPTLGGTAPVYQWKVNGLVAGTGASLSYSPANGDIVALSMTSNVDCPMPATVTNETPALTVIPSTLPTAAVTVTPSNFVCPGTKVTFNVTGTTTGSAPSYSWINNGIPVATGTSYSVTPTDSVVVFCQMVSNAMCATTSYVLSNNSLVAINEPVLPMFMISDLTSTSVNKGESVTLKAVVANPGSFSYQWYVHGNAISGETNPTFTYSYENDQEVVKCVVTSHGVCGGLSSTQSTLITVRDNTGVRQVASSSDVRIMPNPNKGTFTVKGSLGTSVDQEVTLEITNMLGQTVYTNKVMTHNGEINQQVQLAGNLANGMYLLNVHSVSGSDVFHFVIEQ